LIGTSQSIFMPILISVLKVILSPHCYETIFLKNSQYMDLNLNYLYSKGKSNRFACDSRNSSQSAIYIVWLEMFTQAMKLYFSAGKTAPPSGTGIRTAFRMSETKPKYAAVPSKSITVFSPNRFCAASKVSSEISLNCRSSLIKS